MSTLSNSDAATIAECTEAQQAIYNALAEILAADTRATAKAHEIAANLPERYSTQKVASNLRVLGEHGLVERIGGTNGGRWRLTDDATAVASTHNHETTTDCHEADS